MSSLAKRGLSCFLEIRKKVKADRTKDVQNEKSDFENLPALALLIGTSPIDFTKTLHVSVEY
jgi:hypothetical protein